VTESENEPDAPDGVRTRLISVIDAVCCVYFCAAGKGGLLLNILTRLGMEILIPAEVEREVLRKRLGQLQSQWPRLRASSRVQILEELKPTDIRSDVVATVARIRGTSTRLALSTSRDLGEAIVIGHAKVLSDAGHEVYVVIDDQGGQVLASLEDLVILTVEDLLIAAVQLRVLAPDRLRKTYEDLIPFGSGLPTWDASTIKRKYKEWRQSQKPSGGT
jgi:hypothetical protein